MEVQAQHRYECDPHGDVILLLRDPDTPFAAWHDNVEPADDSQEPDPTEIPLPEEDEDGEPEITEIRVSSRRLMQASPYFDKMLNGDWKESKTFQSNGCLRIELSDWDIDAFQILMNIFHGRTRKVPEEISLEMLTKFAVLVDFYECLEAVDFFARVWIERLISPLPDVYSRDVMLWIWISWVFERPDVFDTASYIAIMFSEGPIQTMGLPIPQRVTRSIDLCRQEYIGNLIAALHNLILDICKSGGSCTAACSTIRLGGLIQQMNSRLLYSPRPEAPFLGFSVDSLKESIRTIHTPKFRLGCDEAELDDNDSDEEGAYSAYTNVFGKCNARGCGLRRIVREITDGLNGQMVFPNLEDFLS